MVSAVWG